MPSDSHKISGSSSHRSMKYVILSNFTWCVGAMNVVLILTGGTPVRVEVDVMDTVPDEDEDSKAVVEDSAEDVIGPGEIVGSSVDEGGEPGEIVDEAGDDKDDPVDV